MIKSIEYSVFFPATGRSLANKVSFQKGLGSITGANEAGKSFVIEMIRYAFFGTDALRGKADEYKKLNCQMVFAVKGQTYTITRKNGNATISRGDEVLATGTRPVNEKIITEVLGYGLAVFDVANVANQDKLLQLGEMRPAERKRMVDSVIGLGVIEDLGKWANETALEKTREADTIQRVVRTPVEPIEPTGYQTAAEIDVVISALRAEKETYDKLQGILSVNRTEPKKPETKVDLPSEQIRSFAEDQEARVARLSEVQKQLQMLPATPSISLDAIANMDRGHERYDLWQARQRFEVQHPIPKYTEGELSEMISNWDLIDLAKRGEALNKTRQELLDYGSHTCPKCNHGWPVMSQELEKLGEIPDCIKPSVPALSRQEISREAGKIQDYQDTLQRRPTDPEEANPRFTRTQLEQFRVSWVRSAERPALEHEAAQLAALIHSQPNYREMFQARKTYEDALDRFFLEHTAYHIWLTERQEAQAKAADIEPRIARLPGLNLLWVEAVSYERSLFEYNRDLENYSRSMLEVQTLREEADGWKRGKDALITLRSLVKQHLVPSLNKVASALLKSMTGNQRQSIVVDDEFEVLVDGQALNTLSGSGKAVANLALRIGLGQVLTNNVLSLFMGDEIDASMDADRADNTALTLQALKQSISQILLVTHKSPSADYNIALGTSHANSNGLGQRGTQKVGG